MSLVEALLAALLAALVGSGLVRAFVAQGEFQSGWMEIRDAERSVGSAIEIVARAIEEAGFVGCRSSAPSHAGAEPVARPFPLAVGIESGASGDVVTIRRVEESLPLVSYTPTSAVAIGRFVRKPKPGRALAIASCRGGWGFRVNGVRHLNWIGQKRTEVFGDLASIAEALVGHDRADGPGAQAPFAAPGGASVGLVNTRRYYSAPNADDGGSLWVTLNGGRASELVRGINRLTAERFAANLFRVRVEAVLASGRVIRERTVFVRNAAG